MCVVCSMCPVGVEAWGKLSTAVLSYSIVFWLQEVWG